MTTRTNARGDFIRAYQVLRWLHGEVANMLSTIHETIDDPADAPESIQNEIARATIMLPGIDLLIEGSDTALSAEASYEERFVQIMEALNAQPYWEAARIFAVAEGTNKTVDRTDNGYVTTVSYMGDDVVHTRKIFTTEHPGLNVEAALTIAGLGTETSHLDAMDKQTWRVSDYSDRWHNSAAAKE